MQTNLLARLLKLDAPRTQITFTSPYRVSVLLVTLGSVACATQRGNAPEAGEMRSVSSKPPDVDAMAPALAPVVSQPSSDAISSDVTQDHEPAELGDASAGSLTAGTPSASTSAETMDQPPPGSLLVPGRIEAERFARFNETDAPMDASECGDGRVDMGLTDDAGGECYVGWTQGGEWLEYDVWASESNVYSLILRLASGDAGREVAVLVDGNEVGRVLAPGQGWDEFQDVVLEDVAVPAGVHAVRVAFISGQTNFNFMVFESSGAPVPLPSASGTSQTPDSSAPEVGDLPVAGEGCAEAPAGYELVWSDEFDYAGLPDGERWGYEVGGDGWGNGELQYYTDARLANAKVGGGVLTITAVPEVYEGNDYTSAKLNSSYGASNPGSWNEGIVRVRARLPAGLGTWPALWMMPDNCTEGWPACGEIDVMEHVGYDEGTVHGTIHTDAFNHVEGTQRGQSVRVEDATSAFHEYALIWQAGRLQWLVDGEVYFTIDKDEAWGFAEWPFSEKKWHLKMNLAVGGAWGGAEGVDRGDVPASFQVDYVCVYQPAP